MNYYIITSKKKERILITKSYEEAYDFIVKNTDAKIRTINFNARPKIMNKKEFLNEFLKNTENKNKFCELTKAMIKGDTNIYDYLKIMGMLDYYREYIKEKSNTL